MDLHKCRIGVVPDNERERPPTPTPPSQQLFWNVGGTFQKVCLKVSSSPPLPNWVVFASNTLGWNRLSWRSSLAECLNVLSRRFSYRTEILQGLQIVTVTCYFGLKKKDKISPKMLFLRCLSVMFQSPAQLISKFAIFIHTKFQTQVYKWNIFTDFNVEIGFWKETKVAVTRWSSLLHFLYNSQSPFFICHSWLKWNN